MKVTATCSNNGINEVKTIYVDPSDMDKTYNLDVDGEEVLFLLPKNRVNPTYRREFEFSKTGHAFVACDQISLSTEYYTLICGGIEFTCRIPYNQGLTKTGVRVVKLPQPLSYWYTWYTRCNINYEKNRI